MDASTERLAADYPGWRIECTTGGTRYYSALPVNGTNCQRLGSPTITGLRAMLERRAAGTVEALGASMAEAGY